MLFDTIDKILHNKKPININIGDESIHPYIMNRWLSMYSPQIALLVNNTGNWLYSVFGEDTSKYFKFLQQFLPRVAQKRIFYIKKAKPNKTVDDTDNVDILAQGLELSKREIKLLVEYERQHRPTNTDNESN